MRLLLSFGPTLGLCVLNVHPDIPEELVEHMQKRIFIESRHLSPPEQIFCSSLDGPHCFGLNTSTAVGVVPEISALGFSDLLPFFSSEIWNSATLVPAPGGASDALVSNFQVTDQLAGRKISPFYSNGLPQNVVASWDGRWLVESETSGFSSISLASYLPGYLRFSQPVLLRRLWLEIPEAARSVYVVLRRHGQTVWMSRKFAGNSDHTIDVCEFGIDGHGPTVGVDEISVFASDVGVKIAKLELLQSSGTSLLVPGLLLAKAKNDRLIAKPTLIDQNLINSQLVVSLHEAIKQKRSLQVSQHNPEISLDLFTVGLAGNAELEILEQEISSSEFPIPDELRRAIGTVDKNLPQESKDEVVLKRRQVLRDLFLTALLHA